jgi:hypothetical protein
VLAAAAIDAGATLLVSADHGFDKVPGLRHVVPDADRVETLISASPSWGG